MARRPHHVLSISLLFVAAGLFVTSRSEGHAEVSNITREDIETSSLDIALTCHDEDDAMAMVSRQQLQDSDLVSAADQACFDACKKGGAVWLGYCARIPLPQVRAACLAAAAGGTVACMAFCYAK